MSETENTYEKPKPPSPNDGEEGCDFVFFLKDKNKYSIRICFTLGFVWFVSPLFLCHFWIWLNIVFFHHCLIGIFGNKPPIIVCHFVKFDTKLPLQFLKSQDNDILWHKYRRSTCFKSSGGLFNIYDNFWQRFEDGFWYSDAFW